MRPAKLNLLMQRLALSMSSDATLYRLAARVGRRLLRTGRRLSTAESCTGGWIAKAITDVPGSSGWFEAGYVTYSNAAKLHALGVKASTIKHRGAVSRAVVREMAAGALRKADCDIAIAVSGIAGPDGGTVDKPVGTVWICWARRTATATRFQTVRKLYRGDRAAIRRKAVTEALRGVLRK